MSVVKKVFSCFKKISSPLKEEKTIKEKRERRKYPRYKDYQVTRVYFPNRTYIETIVDDISLGGVGLFPRGQLELNGRYGLILKFGSDELRFIIRILWHKMIKDESAYGAEFVNLTPKDLDMLKDYVDEIKWRSILFNQI